MPYKTSEGGHQVGSTGNAATTEVVVESTDELHARPAPHPLQPACSSVTASQLPGPRLDSAGPVPTPERRFWRRRISQRFAAVLSEHEAATAHASRPGAGVPVGPRSRSRARTSPDALPVIIFAYANDRSPDGRYLKNLPEECRANKAALEDAADGNHVELVTCMNATLEEVIATCQKYRKRIVGLHYAGHSDGESVLFERGDGSPTAATAASFAEFLGELPALKFAFLNGCATRGQVEALRSRGVPVVLATSTLVRDEVAQTVSYYYYLGMGRGETIADAFRHATVDTRFRFSADRSSPSAGLYRDVNEAATPSEHLPWELHGDEAARQYRLVPVGRARSLDALAEPSRPSDSARFRKVVRYQAVTGCLIALAIAAAVAVAAVKVWSIVGMTEPTVPASRTAGVQRDRVAIAAQLVASVGNRTAEPSRALDRSAQPPAALPRSEPSATSHAQAQPPRPPPAQTAATSPRGAPRLHVAERDRLPPSHAELLPRPSALQDLDKETVQRRIRSHREELKSCYEQQLLRKPALRGTVNTRFLITPAGTIASLEVSGLDADVSSCVADTIRHIEFPRTSSSSSVLVNYPFHFRITGSDVE